ncbi:MAG: hypothetical protein JO302_07465 [Candidatus Eremiobacteraeota bacterium]|nr:hypothetical protein [Candidatus Eremiobacteraeota bacterium]
MDSYYDRIYVPVEPAPKPALKPGQQFIAFGGIVKDPLTNRDGDSFGWHPLTLIDRTANTLRFRTAEGTTFSIPSTARTVTDVTGMLPIADDASVAAARTAYLGRTVFTTHNFIGLANNMATQNLIDSFRVSGVYRSYGFVGVVNLNGENDDPSSVVAVDPIVITFDRCPADPSGHCDVFYTLALDSWHAARILSLHPVIDPRWPARYRDAAKAETVVPGMTYDMVAAAIGWPSRPGTIAQLKQLGRWNYERNSPFQATVYFSHGRVTKYDPPGELP